MHPFSTARNSFSSKVNNTSKCKSMCIPQRCAHRSTWNSSSLELQESSPWRISSYSLTCYQPQRQSSTSEILRRTKPTRVRSNYLWNRWKISKVWTKATSMKRSMTSWQSTMPRTVEPKRARASSLLKAETPSSSKSQEEQMWPTRSEETVTTSKNRNTTEERKHSWEITTRRDRTQRNLIDLCLIIYLNYQNTN